MNIEDLQKICKNLPGVTQDIKWEDHLCFNVGQKMFLILSPDAVPVTASLKLLPDDFELLTGREGFRPSQYLAKHNWIFVDSIKRFNKKEWEKYILQSYNLVASKLTIKLRKQLKINL